jgi:hypothetical protein
MGSSLSFLDPLDSETQQLQRDSTAAERLYGHFSTNFLIVFALRIVNGTRSIFASGTVEKSDVPGFLRRHQ